MLLSGLVAAVLAAGVGVTPAQAISEPVVEPLTLAQVQADPTIKLVSVEIDSGTRLDQLGQKSDPTRVGVQNIYANPNRILCSYTGGLIRTYDWSNKNPRTCGGHYRVYSNNTLVFQHLSTNGPGLWGIISQGYAAVETWCRQSPAACSIITGIGVSIVTRQLRI